MAPSSEQLLRQIHRLTAGREPAADAELLDRFVRRRDEDAFAELARRHGGMVLGVCRRVLGDAHRAEDALQATFLVLANKAATVRPGASLAAWLHTVARHLALRCRRAEERRRRHEADRARDAGAPPPRDPLEEISARELLLVFDEELRRLPEVYRLPLILCALEGRTTEEAARHLGWPHGSLRGRLARGRARLQARLARRGVVLPAGMIALLLAPRAGEAAARAARSALAARTPGTGGVLPRVAELAEGSVP